MKLKMMPNLIIKMEDPVYINQNDLVQVDAIEPIAPVNIPEINNLVQVDAIEPIAPMDISQTDIINVEQIEAIRQIDITGNPVIESNMGDNTFDTIGVTFGLAALSLEIVAKPIINHCNSYREDIESHLDNINTLDIEILDLQTELSDINRSIGVSNEVIDLYLSSLLCESNTIEYGYDLKDNRNYLFSQKEMCEKDIQSKIFRKQQLLESFYTISHYRYLTPGTIRVCTVLAVGAAVGLMSIDMDQTTVTYIGGSTYNGSDFCTIDEVYCNTKL